MLFRIIAYNAVNFISNLWTRNDIEITWARRGWYIWLTDRSQEHVYNNYLGTLMDCNLGAIIPLPKKTVARYSLCKQVLHFHYFCKRYTKVANLQIHTPSILSLYCSSLCSKVFRALPSNTKITIESSVAVLFVFQGLGWKDMLVQVREVQHPAP